MTRKYSTMTSNERITVFPVRDDRSQREYLVRIAADDLQTFVTRGTRLDAVGEAGWTVPGRSWAGEASRTLLQAQSVQAGEMALAA
jgi:hypothetical protein